jgi:hypothetical protein
MLPLFRAGENFTINTRLVVSNPLRARINAQQIFRRILSAHSKMP